MIRKTTAPFLVVLFLIIILPFFYFFSFSLNVARDTGEQPVKYELPYPGLMEDSPLYFLKNIRDSIVEFTTRDNLKKAQLHVLFADKRVRAAELLQEKGHEEKVSDELKTSQSYFRNALQDVLASKQQGVSASAEFITKMKLSNLKHREVIQRLKQVVPGAQQRALEEILKENQKLRDSLQSL